MIRFSLRLLGLLLLAAGFAALVVDGTRAVAAGTWRFASLAATLAAAGADGAAARLVDRLPVAWRAGATAILDGSPTAIVLGGAGLLVFALTARRRARREDRSDWAA